LLTYGHDNFCLEILEYCDKFNTIKREQFYIDLIKPEYNILAKAESSLGFKHSQETLNKYKSRKLSDKALTNLRKSKVGATLSPLALKNRLLSISNPVSITNTKTNEIKQYDSIREAARQLKTNHNTLRSYMQKGKLFRGVYMIIKNK
jgi:group I intron endonuclease